MSSDASASTDSNTYYEDDFSSTEEDSSQGGHPALPRAHPYMTTGKAINSVQSLSRIQLFATPWTAACQASLSFTISRRLPNFIE